jgi:hypothetical protein
VASRFGPFVNAHSTFQEGEEIVVDPSCRIVLGFPVEVLVVCLVGVGTSFERFDFTFRRVLRGQRGSLSGFLQGSGRL